MRAGAPLKFPTDTVAINKLVPDFDKYKGLTPDFGRMEPTMSDPSVQQQYGMVVGIPNAKQVNALETLNLRGERSVTCKKECDAATGALPSQLPAACEKFRKHPDALERAAELDKQYGRNPDTQGHAAVLRADVVQGRLRREGHALHRRRRREVRDGCRARWIPR